MSNVEIESLVRQKCAWESLPQHVKQVLGNSRKEYDASVLSYSLKNQLRYRGNLVRQVFKDEPKYYEKLVQFSRDHLMLFPYHLSDVVIRGLKITPFQYYVAMVDGILAQERSYDSLPNFTAADCLRLLGIGRNQYIDLINQCKASKRLFVRTVNRKSLLPTKPQNIQIEPWWNVNVGFISVDDVKDCIPEEKELIDQLIDSGPKHAGELHKEHVMNLYSIGLVYLEVPVSKDDYFSVPPLEGFVMNRVLGDYMETLLYKIFVSIDEKTSVDELASLLSVDVNDVQTAISLYCRLGFAKKKGAEVLAFKLHPTWRPSSITSFSGSFECDESLLDELDAALSEPTLAPTRSMTMESISNGAEDDRNHQENKRVAFLFDSSLTAYLMMGNLSSGLKTHAVTMFEVGKLASESIGSLLEELEKIQCEDGEGEAKRYFDHAYNLKETIRFLLDERSLRREDGEEPVELDLVHYASLQSLEASAALRLLKKNYYMLLSMAPLSSNAGLLRITEPVHFGPPSPSFCSPWFKLFLYEKTGCGPPSLFLPKGTRLKKIPHIFLDYEMLMVTSWAQNPGVVPIQTAMLVLSDALNHSAVFVQGYSQQSAITEKYFALPSTDVEELPKEIHLIVKKVKSVLNLGLLCGYLTLVKTKKCQKFCDRENLSDSKVQCDSDVHINRNFKATVDDSGSAIQDFDPSLIRSGFQTSVQTSVTNGDNIENPSLLEEIHFDKHNLESSDENELTSQNFCERDTCKVSQDPSTVDKNPSSDNGVLGNDLYSELKNCGSVGENFGISSSLVGNSSDKALTEGADRQLPEEMVAHLGSCDSEWDLYSADFGIPLFEQELNRRVCRAVQKERLLSTERSAEVSHYLKQLEDELSAFIIRLKGSIQRTAKTKNKEHSQLNLPMQSIAFLNGKLHIPYKF